MSVKKWVQVYINFDALLAFGCQGQYISRLGVGDLSKMPCPGTLAGLMKTPDSSQGLQLWPKHTNYTLLMLSH